MFRRETYISAAMLVAHRIRWTRSCELGQMTATASFATSADNQLIVRS